jgi:hypothetical protein
VELGYDTNDFPSHYEPGWFSLVDQPRELTPRSPFIFFTLFSLILNFLCTVWKAIRPKLEMLIAEEKESRLKWARDRRLVIRKAELKPFWESLVTDIRDSQERNHLPPFSDFCELITVAAMLVEDDARTAVTEERFLARKDAILADIKEYQIRIKRELVKLHLAHASVGTENQDTTTNEGEEIDLSIIDRATTLFKCGGSWHCKALLPYPDIFEHEHLKELATISSFALGRLPSGVKVQHMAALLLKALGIPEDTSATTLAELKGRFLCLCGHPDFRKPMDFGTLVSWPVALKVSQPLISVFADASLYR